VQDDRLLDDRKGIGVNGLERHPPHGSGKYPCRCMDKRSGLPIVHRAQVAELGAKGFHTEFIDCALGGQNPDDPSEEAGLKGGAKGHGRQEQGG